MMLNALLAQLWWLHRKALEKIHKMILDNRKAKLNEIAHNLKISKERAA